jgi:ATP-dependent Clp protease ATP-binding subunit ClpC
VILFDEIEKAHPEVFNIMLQILEDGRLTDGHGRTVDFRNTVIVMTSNLGTEEFQRQAIGFSLKAKQEEGDTGRLKSAVDAALKKAFRPEFLNRIDDIIIFNPLSAEDLKKIIGLMISEVQKRLSEREVEIELDDNAKAWLLKEGYEPVYGARPLRRAIQRYVENQLSNRILSGDINDGDHVFISTDDKGLTFNVRQNDNGNDKIAVRKKIKSKSK